MISDFSVDTCCCLSFLTEEKIWEFFGGLRPFQEVLEAILN